MDGDVGIAVLRIMAGNQTHGDIGTGILGGVCGSGDQLPEIKVRIIYTVDVFLTGS